MRILMVAASAVWLAACSSSSPESSQQKQPQPTAAKPKPADESRRLPQSDLISSEVVESSLMGKSFMPGGTVGRYKKGKRDYQLFLARASSATDAAIRLRDWQKALTNPEFVASFGGYFGQDAGVPVFVFTKGDWIAGVSGLPRADADAIARVFAARL